MVSSKNLRLSHVTSMTSMKARLPGSLRQSASVWAPLAASSALLLLAVRKSDSHSFAVSFLWLPAADAAAAAREAAADRKKAAVAAWHPSR
jgi:hypothetical protein